MNEYVVSCNLKRFDLINYFSKNNYVIWKQAKACKPGDVVYIYVGYPYSRLYYRCRVMESNQRKVVENNSFYIKDTEKENIRYMTLKLVKQLPEKGFSLNELLAHGLKTVQCATQVNEELHRYIISNIN